MSTNREIGTPERRAATELRPFGYDVARDGTLSDATVVVFNDRTNVDVTLTVFGGAPSVTITGQVLTTPAPVSLQVFTWYRVHFRYKVNGQPFDEWRRVIVEP